MAPSDDHWIPYLSAVVDSAEIQEKFYFDEENMFSHTSEYDFLSSFSIFKAFYIL